LKELEEYDDAWNEMKNKGSLLKESKEYDDTKDSNKFHVQGKHQVSINERLDPLRTFFTLPDRQVPLCFLESLRRIIDAMYKIIFDESHIHMFNEPEEGRVQSHMGPSLYIFYESKERKIDGLFIF
jgi:hypothetical protein